MKNGGMMVGWIAFNVVLPVLSVPLVWIGSWLTGSNRHFMSIIRDGQLCFFSTTLAASTVNDMIHMQNFIEHSGPLMCFGLLLCIILSIYIYAIAVTSGSGANPGYDTRLGYSSIFAASVTISIVLSCRGVGGLFT